MERDSVKLEEIGKIINCMRGINNGMQRYSHELKRDYNITGRQLGALRVISHYPEVTLKELSKLMYLHISTVSGILDRLESSGYISRSRRNSDHRELILRLTPKGMKIIKEAPLSGLGYFVVELYKMPLTKIKRIGRTLETLTRTMKIEDNDMKCIS
jgi:MarR family transcriptional regulator, organic hydroperoxide resistance regulator